MCYYNGQKVTRDEFIRLKQLEKAVANYDFLPRDLQVGFDYSMNAVLKRDAEKENFDIVQANGMGIYSFLFKDERRCI